LNAYRVGNHLRLSIRILYCRRDVDRYVGELVPYRHGHTLDLPPEDRAGCTSRSGIYRDFHLLVLAGSVRVIRELVAYRMSA